MQMLRQGFIKTKQIPKSRCKNDMVEFVPLERTAISLPEVKKLIAKKIISA